LAQTVAEGCVPGNCSYRCSCNGPHRPGCFLHIPPPSAASERAAILAALQAKLKAFSDDYIGGGLSRDTREQLHFEMHGLKTAIGIVKMRKDGGA
jgi:hypothetical protein